MGGSFLAGLYPREEERWSEGGGEERGGRRVVRGGERWEEIWERNVFLRYDFLSSPGDGTCLLL